jgi:hypothetical protein
VASAPLAEFRARARAEADRYGPDPWVFVRELLQNARDAGATRVEFTCEVSNGRWRLHCRDDGEGMSFGHARRYLFSLYASSKESRRDQVGRFGVGFWSILRFEPDRIVIRSRPRKETSGQDPEDRAEAWELELAGDLESARRATPRMEPGTELVLERAAVDGELGRRVFDAAFQNARFLATRDDPERPLKVTVDGKPVGAQFGLPAPSASFRRGRVRGVVALGSAARVELFSRGLRVRAAASLADFVVAGGRSTDRSRVQFTELPGRLAPQALLESDALELMLSRSDARDNKALRRLVMLAQRELEGLIARQLDAARPLPLWQRPWAALRDLVRRSLAARMVLAALAGAAIAAGVAYALWGDRIWARFRGALDVPVWSGSSEHGSPASAELPARYSDLAALYRGPQVDVLTGSGARESPLSFRPTELHLHFAALVFPKVGEAGQARAPAPAAGYDFATCIEGQPCVDVELRLDAPAGPLRLPVPTGHRLVARSVALDGGASLEVAAGEDGAAVLVLGAASQGTLRYQTAPALDRGGPEAGEASDLLPADLRKMAARMRRSPLDARVDSLTEWVAGRVVYSTAPTVAAEHRALQADGVNFIARALEIGQGDCDVQNGLLVALLQEAGVPSRLAIGFVGQDGRVNPWLHAWAEYRDRDGAWKVADASVLSGGGVGVIPGGPDMLGETGEEPAAEPGVQPGIQPAPEGATPARRTAPVAAPGQAVPRDRLVRARGLGVGLALAAATLALAAVALRGRTRRQLALDASGDLSRLLQGALQQPEVFRAVPAVFERPLVPTASGGALSLAQVKALAGRGRLFRTRRRAQLALDARIGDAAVLDDQSPEAKAVADALGAIDLDFWDMLLGTARTTPLLDAVTARLRETGEAWQVLASPSLGSEELRSVDLAPLRLKRSAHRGKRVVLVGETNPWLQDAAGAFATRPAAAVFAALDYLLDRLDLGAARTASLLQESARAAVLEAAPGRPA